MNILLPQFFTYGLINVPIFELGYLCVRPGTLSDLVRDYFWHLWVWEGLQCLVNDVWLKSIAVGHPNILLHILHCPGELVKNSQSKIKNITL